MSIKIKRERKKYTITVKAKSKINSKLLDWVIAYKDIFGLFIYSYKTEVNESVLVFSRRPSDWDSECQFEMEKKIVNKNDIEFEITEAFREFEYERIKKFNNITEGLDYKVEKTMIRKVPGYIVEAVTDELLRSRIFSEMEKMLNSGMFKIYGLRHIENDWSKPYTIEDNVLFNRFGWFITTDEKDILKDKKDRTLVLSKKNMKSMNERVNFFDIYNGVVKDGEDNS